LRQLNLISGNKIKSETHKKKNEDTFIIETEDNGSIEISKQKIQQKLLNLRREEIHILDCADEVAQKVDELESLLRESDDLPEGWTRKRVVIK